MDLRRPIGTAPPAAVDPGSRRAARYPALTAILVAGFVAACSAAGTAGPTLPSNLPSVPPVSAPMSGGGTACVDSTTMGIINQVQGYASEAPSILSANKDKVIAGLQAFQPADQTTATWRNEVVTALQGGDFAAAAAKISQGVTSGITLQSC